MGTAKDEKYATGMIAGAIGLVAYSAAAALAVKHLGAVAGSIVAWVAWVIPAASVFTSIISVMAPTCSLKLTSLSSDTLTIIPVRSSVLKPTASTLTE